MHEPKRESPEGELLEVLKNPKDWINVDCSCEDDVKK